MSPLTSLVSATIPLVVHLPQQPLYAVDNIHKDCEMTKVMIDYQSVLPVVVLLKKDSILPQAPIPNREL